jgi:5-aminopentanamidase
VKVAAYQTPLLPNGSMGALERIRQRVAWCDDHDVDILCCPEAILGGLADYAADPFALAIDAEHLGSVLTPLASASVTTIVGFTELGSGGKLYNSAGVFHRGKVAGVYRKLHPAINRSVYEPGSDIPIFAVGQLRFGIVICYDSNFPELAATLAAKGATALFIPTNNGLPPLKGGATLVRQAREVDVSTAVTNKLWVIRADVAGSVGDHVSYGSSAIVSPAGVVVQSARELEEDLLVCEI